MEKKDEEQEDSKETIQKYRKVQKKFAIEENKKNKKKYLPIWNIFVIIGKYETSRTK